MKSTKEWISISDMMTGLMMVFLFISIVYINQVKEESQDRDELIQQVKELTKKQIDDKILIDKRLRKEFQVDLKKWKAKIITDSLVIQFASPDIMFAPAKSEIKREFKKILDDFCPRYFKILYKLKEKIEEVRVEGHTSADWGGKIAESAYFKNMKLSQDRSRAVLHYCIKSQNIKKEITEWTKTKLTANGLSSSRLICKDDTVRCRHLNRRVEFRIQVKEIQNTIIKLLTK